MNVEASRPPIDRQWLSAASTAIRAGVVWGLVLLVLLCVEPRGAHAGSYVMRSCNVPGKPSTPAAPWRWIHTGATYAIDDCARGGGFGINAGPMERATAAAIVLDRPGDGPLGAITIRQVKLWLVARLGSSGSSLFVAWSSGGATGTTAAAYPFGPPGASTLTDPYVTPMLASDTASFVLLLSCSGDTNDGCVPSSVTPLEVRGAEVTLHEDVPPVGAIGGGLLLSGDAQSGMRSIDYSVADQESGVAEIAAVLGTTTVAVQDLSGECPRSDFAACPRTRNGTLSIDTRKVPNGSYPLTLRVTDAAGNRATTLLPTAIQINNQRPQPPNGEGATGDARLTVRFVGRRASSLTVPFNRGTAVRGRLRTASGNAIANARVEVTESGARGSRRAISAAAVTRADGSFTYAVRARGTSRTLKFQYRPNLGGSDVAATKRLRLAVAASSSLRVRLNGIRVIYRGRVISRPLPRAGKRIEVQGRVVGGAWTTFAATRTNHAGRFSGTYRLRVRRPGVHLQFRVRVPVEDGYPYASSTGQPVTRVVR